MEITTLDFLSLLDLAKVTGFSQHAGPNKLFFA